MGHSHAASRGQRAKVQGNLAAMKSKSVAHVGVRSLCRFVNSANRKALAEPTSQSTALGDFRHLPHIAH